MIYMIYKTYPVHNAERWHVGLLFVSHVDILILLMTHMASAFYCGNLCFLRTAVNLLWVWPTNNISLKARRRRWQNVVDKDASKDCGTSRGHRDHRPARRGSVSPVWSKRLENSLDGLSGNNGDHWSLYRSRPHTNKTTQLGALSQNVSRIRTRSWDIFLERDAVSVYLRLWRLTQFSTYKLKPYGFIQFYLVFVRVSSMLDRTGKLPVTELTGLVSSARLSLAAAAAATGLVAMVTVRRAPRPWYNSTQTSLWRLRFALFVAFSQLTCNQLISSGRLARTDSDWRTRNWRSLGLRRWRGQDDAYRDDIALHLGWVSQFQQPTGWTASRWRRRRLLCDWRIDWLVGWAVRDNQWAGLRRQNKKHSVEYNAPLLPVNYVEPLTCVHLGG